MSVSRASPGPLTTQPMTDSVIGVVMWASALLQRLDGLDDVELLARAGRAGDDVDAAVAQAERLQDVEADLTSSTGSAESETRMVSPMPAHSSVPMPIDDLTVPVRRPPASVTPRCSG